MKLRKISSSSIAGEKPKGHHAKTVFVIMLVFVVLILVGLLISYQLKEYYAQQDPMLRQIQQHLLPLHPAMARVQLYEGSKSYTINKQKIYLCLRDSAREYYDFNMLIYVTIHELAHVLCEEVGHTPRFHTIFQDLLEKASRMGLYDPTKPIILDYCGHH